MNQLEQADVNQNLPSNIQKNSYPKKELDGLVLLDKPIGLTSNRALQEVKHLFGAKKAGHTGSLDPLASGMLPICFGQATKFSQFLLNSDKTYLTVAKLGITTTTGDAEGEVVKQRPLHYYSSEVLNEIFKKFLGIIKQIPSMYSAIKHKGVPLYKFARDGITIDRSARDIQIHKLTLLAQEEDKLTLEIHCSKGTYIRTLVEDIGEALGCGAHVTYLRRLSVGYFNTNQLVTMEEIQSAVNKKMSHELILPCESSVQSLPIVKLEQNAASKIINGQLITTSTNQEGYIRIYSPEDIFIGVGEVKDGKIVPLRFLSKNR